MPGPILPALLRISTLLSQAKIRCCPPRGVIVVSVSGIWTALRDQLVECSLTVDLPGRIEIGHPHPAGGAGRCADHGVGPFLPPRADPRFVLAGVLEAIRGERLLI